MWDVIFNWSELAKHGTDALVYFVMASVGSVLFLIRLGLALFADADSDFDTDIDGAVDTDVSFTLFSLLSILAFFMGTGWMGLACRVDWGLGAMPSALIASGTGVAMMAFASGLMYGTRRLNKQVVYDPKTAIGKTGRVYMTIPEKGKGTGQVEVTVSGRRKVMRAVSSAAEIEAFTDVTVLDSQDDETLVVEPKT